MSVTNTTVYKKFFKSKLFLTAAKVFLVVFLVLLFIKLIQEPKLPEEVFEGEKFILVSAYYDIGKFMKPGGLRTPEEYFAWMDKYRFIENQLYFFSDSRKVLAHMKTTRKGLPTTLILLNRSELIGFKKIEKIKHIFTLPGFGEFPEETGNAEYVAIMHSKHDMVRRVIKMAPKNSSYFAWVDAGLFRYTSPSEMFSLKASKFTDKTRLTMTQAREFWDYPIDYITKKARVWVSGAIFCGHVAMMLEFCDVYEEFLNQLLSMNLVATDEQLLYSMYSSEGRALNKRSVRLNVFQCDYYGLYVLLSKVPTSDSCSSFLRFLSFY